MTLQASWKHKDLQVDSLRTGLAALAADLGMEIKLRLTDPRRRQRVALMVTKETHSFDAILAVALDTDPALVLGNYANFTL
jgi:formyltetrahydrofolate hydrolase